MNKKSFLPKITLLTKSPLSHQNSPKSYQNSPTEKLDISDTLSVTSNFSDDEDSFDPKDVKKMAKKKIILESQNLFHKYASTKTNIVHRRSVPAQHSSKVVSLNLQTEQSGKYFFCCC